MKRIILAALICLSGPAEAQWNTVANRGLGVGRGPGFGTPSSVGPCTNAQILTWPSGISANPACNTPGSVTGIFANPTASVGLSAVNGSATTFMRSDAAPQLSQAIVPTWSGVHTFSANPIITNLTANRPVIGGGGSAIGVGTRSGNTTAFVTTTGALTNGDCVSIDANGNFVAAGGACTVGGGGGTVTAATAGQMTYYAATGTTVVGNANATLTAGGVQTIKGLQLNGAPAGANAVFETASSTNFINFVTHVGGAVGGTTLQFIDSGVTNAAIQGINDSRLFFNTAGTTRLTIGPTGDIGINVSPPSAYGQLFASPILEMRQTGGSNFPFLVLSTDQTAASFIGGILWSTSGAASANKNASAIVSQLTATSSTAPFGNLAFQTNNGGAAPATRMTIASDGAVTIGTSVAIGTDVAVSGNADIVGSFGVGIQIVTSGATLSSAQHTVLCDATSGAITLTLPAASGAARREYVVKKIDSSINACTLSGTIDGAASIVLTTQYSSVKVQSNSTQWWSL